MIDQTKFNLFAQVANASHNSDEFKILMKDLMWADAYEEYADAYKSSQDFYFRGRQALSGDIPLKDFEAMIKLGCFDKFLSMEDSRLTIISEDEKTKLVVSDGSCTIKDNNSDFFA
jgi:hypothetical protein